MFLSSNGIVNLDRVKGFITIFIWRSEARGCEALLNKSLVWPCSSSRQAVVATAAAAAVSLFLDHAGEIVNSILSQYLKTLKGHFII